MIANKALRHLETIKENQYQILFEPTYDEILRVIGEEVHIRSNYFNNLELTELSIPCILIIPRKEYIKALNLWLDSKKEYCSECDQNDQCSVTGFVDPVQIEEMKGMLPLDSFDEEREENVRLLCKVFKIIKFADHCDFEHM